MLTSVSLLCLLIVPLCDGQKTILSGQQSPPALDVNWLYGAYIPKGLPRDSLTSKQRVRLWVRQTFTTPGIYMKTVFFSAGDQVNNSPPDWGGGAAGFGRRVASRQAQFVVQNSFVAWGNWKLGYEPRYDRCICTGFWRRSGYAVARNFVTYDRSQRWFRPQLALYGGAFTAGVVAGTWKPADRNLFAEGYRAVFTQVIFGAAANWLGEFAPDIIRMLRGKNDHK
jgi:hypothetical protein